MKNPAIKFHDSHSIPQLGYGLWQVTPEETIKYVQEAIKVGYRSLDSAQIYHNEAALGEAIQRAGVPRSELYITTKIWNDEQGRDKTLRSFDVSMQNLGLEKLDLLLIHWPSPYRKLYTETWKALVEIKKSGRVNSIGVSNFRTTDLKEVIDATGVVPVLNQIELHPHFQQKELRNLHNELGIHTECWSPLGQGKVIADPAIKKIADQHKKSPAQIILRWHMEHGFIAIPKSTNSARLKENFEVFDFKLTAEDLRILDGLDHQDGRVGPDPATAKF